MKVFPKIWSKLLTCLLFLAAAQGDYVDGKEVLTRAEEVRTLFREQAEKALPVKLRGVVIWQSINPNGSFVIHDGEWGIYVDLFMAIERGVWKAGDVPRSETEVGALVEVEGVSDPGGYAPMILPHRIRRVGTKQLPNAQLVAPELLLSGNNDAQRIMVEGVVQSVTRMNESEIAALTLVVDGNSCQVIFERGSELDTMNLLDSRIRIRGVLLPMFNLRSEVAGMKINCNCAADIDVLKQGLADPFLAPRVSLDQLLPFSPNTAPYHRKVTRGVVTFAKLGDFFFLQDGTRGLRVQSPNLSVKLGDLLEVSGFVATSHTLASLENAVFRSLGLGNLPVPAEVTAGRIMNPSFHQIIQPAVAKEDYSGRLVHLKGKLIKIERNVMNYPTVLLMEAEGHTFQAYAPQLSPLQYSSETSHWQEESELELTGVCELDFKAAESSDNHISISSFHLWLRSPLDVRVISMPSWWTAFRLKLALFGSGLVILLTVTWIGLLRRSLRRRTERFEQVMRSHRDVELEYNAAQRERLRLAVDLHDGIKQHLVAASFRVDAAAGHLYETPAAAAIHLQAVSNTLSRTQTELEECLWGLHTVAEGPPELVNLFRHVVANAEQWPPGSVIVESEGPARPLARDVAGSFVLLFQEAAGNAFRHGKATRIVTNVNYGEEALEIRITDNGTGCDPHLVPGPRTGHFGIDGMKKRMLWLSGSLRITRLASGGMEIHARYPWTPSS